VDVNTLLPLSLFKTIDTMADVIQKYLDEDLHNSAKFTDTNNITPCFVYNGSGQVWTSTGYVDPDTIIGGVIDEQELNNISPVVIVDPDMNPLT